MPKKGEWLNPGWPAAAGFVCVYASVESLTLGHAGDQRAQGGDAQQGTELVELLAAFQLERALWQAPEGQRGGEKTYRAQFPRTSDSSRQVARSP